MYRNIYSLIFYLIMPLIMLRMLLRSLKAAKYRKRWSERFAWNKLPSNFDSKKQTIWIHSVSVGETNATRPLVLELMKQYPDMQIYITTMTATGSDTVRALYADKVFHSYIPYDLPFATARFISKVRPSILILMETELWPNLLHFCRGNGVKVILANGRLSKKSFESYKRLSNTTRKMLENIDFVAVQAQADADRFASLGIKPNRMKVSGSLKFIISDSSSKLERDETISEIGASERIVLIAASTRENEEEKLLVSFQLLLKKYPSLLLLLVPRHPERFDKVARLILDRGLKLSRRSDYKLIDDSIQVFLGDSMGEMDAYYSVADIAFVGGSLVDTGCQNVLEPAARGLPVVTGPSQFNFSTICKQLEEAGALKTVQDEQALAVFLAELIADKKRRDAMGSCGKKLVSANQQALPILLDIIAGFVKAA